MTNSIMISSKIDKNTYNTLSKLAKSKKVSKTSILKEGIKIMHKKYIQEQIKKSYANLGNDNESNKLAEFGMDDFNSLYE